MSALAFAFVAATLKSSTEALAAVKAALAARKYSVLFEMDMNSKFSALGLGPLADGRAVHLLDVCHAPTAKKVVEANMDVAFFLPCKVVVRTLPNGGATEVGLLKPSFIKPILSDQALATYMEQVEADLTEAVREAAAGTAGSGAGVAATTGGGAEVAATTTTTTTTTH